MTRSSAATVHAYLTIVGTPGSDEDDLRAVLHPDVVFVEHPSPMSPHGRRHGREEMVAGFLAGKDLLKDQHVEVLELVVDGDRVAARSTWTGIVAHDVGALQAGSRLAAHMAGFFTVHDGLVVRHETYDCYDPFPLAAG